MSIPGNDLPSLQNLIKRDPQIYKEDFLQQVFSGVLTYGIV